MTIRKSISIIGIFLLIIALFFSFEYFNSNNEEGIKNTVFADQRDANLEVKENVSEKAAQQYVDFDIIIPQTEEGLEEPIIHVVEPPKGAVADKKLAKKLTRIESFYISKKNKRDEGIAIVQTNNEIVQLDENGEPLISKTIDIDGTKIKLYECDCKPINKTLLWWYDGEVTTEVTVYGDTNIEKAKNMIKRVLKNKK